MGVTGYRGPSYDRDADYVTFRDDAEQDAVVLSDERHQVVVAPPGTGKTSLAARLAARYADELAPHERVLVLTFSNEARGQLEREAVRQISPSLRRLVNVTNYHSFFWNTVRAYSSALELPPDFAIESRRRRLAILRNAHRAATNALPGYLCDTIAELEDPDLRPALPIGTTELECLLAAVATEQRAGHLVFGDLGALYWKLMRRFPTVAAAYQARYPILIVDEHQDASALQDAVVRHLATRRLVVLADPMQLIHAWRGAEEVRLQRHLAECGREYALSTPHRWHNDPEVGRWLLAVRARLEGRTAPHAMPSSVRVHLTDRLHGRNGMLAAMRFAVLRAFAAGCESVAVLAWTGDNVATIWDHLSRNGLSPRQIGITHTFESTAELAEDLPLLHEQPLVERALATVYRLMPSIPLPLRQQVAQRLGPTGTRKAGSGVQARGLLEAMDLIYLEGDVAFFRAIATAVDAMQSGGHHAPRAEDVRLYSAVGSSGLSIPEDQLRLFRQRLMAMSHASPRRARGLLTMTVHQAKGREFDAVVLYGATDRDFPDTAEFRRLFYVAVTRARTMWDFVAPSGQESPLLAALSG